MGNTAAPSPPIPPPNPPYQYIDVDILCPKRLKCSTYLRMLSSVNYSNKAKRRYLWMKNFNPKMKLKILCIECTLMKSNR